jgi:hypothetical protein
VFRAGSMPGARLTMDRFWVPFDGGVAPGELFAEHLASLRAEPPDSRPGAPVAEIVGLEPAPNRGDTVYLDGGNSAFAESYSWSLGAPPGSAAALSDPDARQTAFVLDVPGSYDVTLTVGTGSQQAVATKSVTIGNRAPVAANDLFELDLTSTAVLAGSLFGGARPDADPDGDALTASLAAGGLPSYGAVTIGADGAFSYSYTGSLATPPDTDTFRYVVSDGFGGTAEAIATVLLNGTAAAARPTAVTQLTADDASVAAASGSTFGVQLAWLASSDDVQVQGYNVYRNGALLAFLPSTAPPGAAVTYLDGTVSPDTVNAYRVTAVAADGESPLSTEHVVAVATSLRRNIQTGWLAGTDTLWRAGGCVGCHRGPAGGLTLFGAPELVVTELGEDAAETAPRRVETAAPLRSLLLCKPLIKSDPMSCPHEGGGFFVSSDPRFQTLLRWVQSGAPNN